MVATPQQKKTLATPSTPAKTTTPITVNVQKDGKAQAGLSLGTTVKTAGGDFKITGVNSDGSYKSEKVSSPASSSGGGSSGSNRTSVKTPTTPTSPVNSAISTRLADLEKRSSAGMLTTDQIRNEMAQNSTDWHGADDATRKALAARNQILGNQIGATYRNGTWDYSTVAPRVNVGTQEQYLDNAGKIANANANIAYNNSIADLKTRVAKIVSDNNLRKSNLDQTYQPLYAQNTQDKYAQEQMTKEILAKNGLLGSGIEIGNRTIDNVKYDGLRRDIDLQKQGELNQINQNIADANELLGIESNKLVQNRGEYLAGQSAQAQQDYNQINIQAQQTDVQNHWNKVNSDLTREDLNLRKETMTRQDAQFYAQLGQDAEQFKQNYEMEKQKLAETIRANKANESINRSQISSNYSIASMQYRKEIEQLKLDAKDKALIADENARLDGGIVELINTGRTDLIIPMIETSMLPSYAKDAKINQMSDVFHPFRKASPLNDFMSNATGMGPFK